MHTVLKKQSNLIIFGRIFIANSHEKKTQHTWKAKHWKNMCQHADRVYKHSSHRTGVKLLSSFTMAY